MLKPSVPTKFTDRTGSSDILAVLVEEFAWCFMIGPANLVGVYDSDAGAS